MIHINRKDEGRNKSCPLSRVYLCFGLAWVKALPATRFAGLEYFPLRRILLAIRATFLLVYSTEGFLFMISFYKFNYRAQQALMFDNQLVNND